MDGWSSGIGVDDLDLNRLIADPREALLCHPHDVGLRDGRSQKDSSQLFAPMHDNGEVLGLVSSEFAEQLDGGCLRGTWIGLLAVELVDEATLQR